jgi:electron transfer flavoprotein beta subunit
MDIFVFLKMVPDVVEELVIAEDCKSLDTESIRMKLNDPDEHALEEAVILKETYGGKIIVVALDAPEVDEVLYTALAKGADRAVKLAGDWSQAQSHRTAELFSSFLSSGGYQLTAETLILLGAQAIDDLEGEVAPYLADILGVPYVGVVTEVKLDESREKVLVTKEFAGGLKGEFEVAMPAVLGIQSAEKPPRYIPIAKVRSVMKSARVETLEATQPNAVSGLSIDKLYVPEAVGRAEMLEGSPDEIAVKVAGLLVERALIRK